MLRGEEIGIKPIKCENKVGNDCLKDYLYKLNDLFFPMAKRYISSKAKTRLMTALKDVCVQLSTTEFPNACIPKKNEILNKCRVMYKNLSEYESDDNESQMCAVIKYKTSMYLKNKPEEDEDILKVMRENKEIAEDYGTNKAFIQMQQELITKLSEKYKIE